MMTVGDNEMRSELERAVAVTVREIQNKSE